MYAGSLQFTIWLSCLWLFVDADVYGYEFPRWSVLQGLFNDAALSVLNAAHSGATECVLHDINVPLKLDLPHLLKVVNDRSHTSRHDVSLIKAVSYSSRDNADYVHSRYRLSANRVLLQDIISAFDQGHTLVLNSVHTHSPSIFEWAQKFARAFGYQCTANLYVTPPNSQGFHPHFDTMSGFVFQIEGRKLWQLYTQTNGALADSVIVQPFLGDQFAFNITPTLIDSVPSPQSHLLSPGSILYVPSGMIHQARTVNTSADNELIEPDVKQEVTGFLSNVRSIHITFGIEIDTPFTVSGFLHLFVSLLRHQHPIFTSSLPLSCSSDSSSSAQPWLWHHALHLLIVSAANVPSNRVFREPLAYFPSTSLAPHHTIEDERWKWVLQPHIRKKLQSAMSILHRLNISDALDLDNVCRTLTLRQNFVHSHSDSDHQTWVASTAAMRARQRDLLNCTARRSWHRLSIDSAALHPRLVKWLHMPLIASNSTHNWTALFRLLQQRRECHITVLNHRLRGLLMAMESELVRSSATESSVLIQAAVRFERILSRTLHHSLQQQQSMLQQNSVQHALFERSSSQKDEL